MRKLLVVLCVLGVIWWFFLRDDSAPSPDPGVRIAEAPRQIETTLAAWSEGDYQFQPLARYEIKARVLSKRRYFFDDPAPISPLDLALGWGDMSDSGVLSHVSVSQDGRWYQYYYDGACPIDRPAITRQSANVHCLPSDPEVKRDLLHLRVNSFVELKGYLVEVRKNGNPNPWRSSLVRDDEGSGACEIFWVTDVLPLEPQI